MAPVGSITAQVEVGGPTTAQLLVAQTGWALMTPPDTEPGVATYSLYVGVANPDADVQARHLEALDQALADGRWEGKRISNGLVMNGQTNPIAASGVLYRATGGEAAGRAKTVAPHDLADSDRVFCGTCCAFRQTNAFLTAGHCVGDVDSRLFIATAGQAPWDPLLEVVSVDRPENADLAVLRVDDGAWPAGVEPFVELPPERPALATEFMAYGFPEDAPGWNAKPGPVARVFRGHVQRALYYERAPYHYHAIEMSVPSPAGLSGGALFWTGNYSRVLGIAAENVSSASYVGHFEETTTDGATVRQIERDSIQYGIAVDLHHLAPWLDQVVPAGARNP